jgi:hypothetical protein
MLLLIYSEYFRSSESHTLGSHQIQGACSYESVMSRRLDFWSYPAKKDLAEPITI